MIARIAAWSRRGGEGGHLMAGLMVAIAIMMIFSTVTFQAWTDVLRRDKEAEMIFRAQDLVRAIQRYRRDHAGQGPTKLEDLLEPSPNRGSYYLRQLWEDPLVDDGKWGLLLQGPGGQIIDPNAEPIGGEGNDPFGQSPFGGAKSKAKAKGKARRLGGTNLAGSTPSGAGQLGGIGNPVGQGDSAGLPIAGVRTLCEDEPFRVYKGKETYVEWWFTYLDLEGNQGGQGNEQDENNNRRRGGTPLSPTNNNPGAGGRGGPGAGARGGGGVQQRGGGGR